uniref:Uncharacterized protein n=1 Tax=Anguilla anguilla TaxID=7936 RepID=A0A0E9XQX3_ANGAN
MFREATRWSSRPQTTQGTSREESVANSDFFGMKHMRLDSVSCSRAIQTHLTQK